VYRLREGVAPAPGLSFVIENHDGLAATLRFWPVALPNGDEAPGIVIDVDEGRVEVDFNHPLAGHEITFKVEILSVSPPPGAG
jgi:predicted N-acetyltransferase YhbS